MYVDRLIIAMRMRVDKKLRWVKFRAATSNFWLARLPQLQAHQQCAATVIAAFYSSSSSHGLGLGGLASRGGSGFGGHKKQGTRMLC